MGRYTIFLTLLLGVAFCRVFGDENYTHGFIQLDNHRNNGLLYYILFKARDENPKAPIVMYLEGGPGQSSMHGLFYQNGPFRLKKDETLERNEFSFNNFADVLYLDQPLGTGFSNCTNVSDIPHNETVILEDLTSFLDKFMIQHHEYTGRPFFLVSQGYGSHFVLPLAHHIVHSKLITVNLKGVALGSPWIRPELQITSLAGFSKQIELINEFKYMASMYGFIIASVFIDLDFDVAAFDLISIAEAVIIGAHHHAFNRYDIRHKCGTGPCNYNFSELNKFLDKGEVRSAMGTIGIPFNYTSRVVFQYLITKNEFLSDKSNLLIEFLDNGTIPIYLYSGLYDWYTNTLGMDETIASIHWTGRAEMNRQEWRTWYTDGELAGRYKHHKNLYYVHATYAGHYVGMDSPAFTMDLITRLIFGSDH
jgi:cathepsin A (carboxypeptidase C)